MFLLQNFVRRVLPFGIVCLTRCGRVRGLSVSAFGRRVPCSEKSSLCERARSGAAKEAATRRRRCVRAIYGSAGGGDMSQPACVSSKSSRRASQNFTARFSTIHARPVAEHDTAGFLARDARSQLHAEPTRALQPTPAPTRSRARARRDELILSTAASAVESWANLGFQPCRGFF
jgi:hypothetical protein